MDRKALEREALDDLRAALRRHVRKPSNLLRLAGVTSLGVAAFASTFGLADAVLFRPLAYPNAHELVRVFSVDEPMRAGGVSRYGSNSFPTFREFARASASLHEFAAFAATPLQVSVNGGELERSEGAVVTGGYFETLRATPLAGRLIWPADDAPGQNSHVAVVSASFARSRYGDAEAVGQPITVNGQPFQIIGVLPSTFVGMTLEASPSVWIPMAAHAIALPDFNKAGNLLESRYHSWLDIIARLREGADLTSAQAELSAVAQLRTDEVPTGAPRPWPAVVPAADAMIDVNGRFGARRISWLVLLASFCLLILSSFNAASLYIAETEARRKELWIRFAIGGAAARLVRTLSLEGLITGLAAGLGGLFLSKAFHTLLMLSLPAGFLLRNDAFAGASAPRVALLALGSGILAALVITLAPAIRAVMGASQDASGTASSGRGRLVGELLVGVQVTGTVALLFCAGLLVRSVYNTSRVDLGFPKTGAIVARVDMARGGYSDERQRVLTDLLLSEVRSVPGVLHAALASQSPLDPGGMRFVVEPTGYEPGPTERMLVDVIAVSPDYFDALGTGVSSGRAFLRSDGPATERVAVVNEAFVRKYFPGRDPLGASLGFLRRDQGPTRIVGTTPTAALSTLKDTSRPTVFVPLSQESRGIVTLLVRSALPEESTAKSVAVALRRLDPNLPVYGMRSIQEQIATAYEREALLAHWAGAFSLLALLLASSGMAAVSWQHSRGRLREFAIRAALGATPRALANEVVGSAFRMTAPAVGVGLLLAMVVARLMRSLIFGVSTVDPTTAAVTVALAGVMALTATAGSQRLAARTAPHSALRHE